MFPDFPVIMKIWNLIIVHEPLKRLREKVDEVFIKYL